MAILTSEKIEKIANVFVSDYSYTDADNICIVLNRLAYAVGRKRLSSAMWDAILIKDMRNRYIDIKEEIRAFYEDGVQFSSGCSAMFHSGIGITIITMFEGENI